MIQLVAGLGIRFMTSSSLIHQSPLGQGSRINFDVSTPPSLSFYFYHIVSIKQFNVLDILEIQTAYVWFRDDILPYKK